MKSAIYVSLENPGTRRHCRRYRTRVHLRVNKDGDFNQSLLLESRGPGRGGIENGLPRSFVYKYVPRVRHERG
jgi:hypothetical protein